MNDITRCPHCSTRMVMTSAGTCPACGKSPATPVTPPPPPPKPPPRHPILFLLCLILIVIGFWRYLARDHQVLDAIVIDLMLIWVGSLGIVALAAVRHVHLRRNRRTT
jgi:hypothetical protein